MFREIVRTRWNSGGWQCRTDLLDDGAGVVGRFHGSPVEPELRFREVSRFEHCRLVSHPFSRGSTIVQKNDAEIASEQTSEDRKPPTIGGLDVATVLKDVKTPVA